MHAAARLVTGTRRCDMIISPVLRQLHWLPVRRRILSRLPAVFQALALGTVSYSPSITMALSCIYYFRDKARYWSKIAIFHAPCNRHPRYQGRRRSIAILFGVEN